MDNIIKLSQVNYNREGLVDNLVMSIPLLSGFAKNVGLYVIEEPTGRRIEIGEWILDEEEKGVVETEVPPPKKEIKINPALDEVRGRISIMGKYEIVITGMWEGWTPDLIVASLMHVLECDLKEGRKKYTFTKNVVNAFIGEPSFLPEKSRMCVKLLLNNKPVNFYGKSELLADSINNILKELKKSPFKSRIRFLSRYPSNEKVMPTVPEVDLNSLNTAEIVVYGLAKNLSADRIKKMLLEVGSSPGSVDASVNNVLNCVKALRGERLSGAKKTTLVAQHFLHRERKELQKSSSTVVGNITRTHAAMVRFKMDSKVVFKER